MQSIAYQIITAEAILVDMKMKWVLDPIRAIPMGQIWLAIIEPIEPPDAAIFRPLARKFVGNICARVNTVYRKFPSDY